jgi:hypothetical protein
MSDYYSHIHDMAEAFKAIPKVAPPPGLFTGKNFMADEIFGYYRESLWPHRTIEVSWGRGMLGDGYIVGLTFRTGGPNDFGDVECFGTPSEAADRVRALVAT